MGGQKVKYDIVFCRNKLVFLDSIIFYFNFIPSEAATGDVL